jgi:hypothetical protein
VPGEDRTIVPGGNLRDSARYPTIEHDFELSLVAPPATERNVPAAPAPVALRRPIAPLPPRSDRMPIDPVESHATIAADNADSPQRTQPAAAAPTDVADSAAAPHRLHAIEERVPAAKKVLRPSADSAPAFTAPASAKRDTVNSDFRPASSATGASTPTIHVTIGRVEVRAVAATSANSSGPARVTQARIIGLDEYLSGRTARGGR